MKKATITIILLIASFSLLFSAYLLHVRRQCIEYVEMEIIGNKPYEVVWARICKSPVIYSKYIFYGWEVVVEPTTPVLDGGMPFCFTWNGRFLNISDPNSL